MPLYEYHCRACQTDCELLVRSDETPRCPQCGATQLEKLFSVVAAHTAGKSTSPAEMPGCGRPQCGLGGCQGM